MIYPEEAATVQFMRRLRSQSAETNAFRAAIVYWWSRWNRFHPIV